MWRGRQESSRRRLARRRRATSRIVAGGGWVEEEAGLLVIRSSACKPAMCCSVREIEEVETFCVFDSSRLSQLRFVFPIPKSSGQVLSSSQTDASLACVRTTPPGLPRATPPPPPPSPPPTPLRACVARDANTGHQLAGGHSSWCPGLEGWTTTHQ